jgi:hypothetical protein
MESLKQSQTRVYHVATAVPLFLAWTVELNWVGCLGWHRQQYGTDQAATATS